MIKGTDNGLLKKYNDILSANRSYKKPAKFGATSFIVCHYAGEVEYENAGFLEKNKDTVSHLITETLSNSESALLVTLFANDP
jgi:myosin heavy subunit